MPIGVGTAILGAGALAAGGAVASGAMASGATDKATNIQSQEFNQTTANNKPFLDTGTAALNQLGGLYGLNGGSGVTDPNATFYQSPDYQFAMSQGIKGIDAGAAAGGMLDSGATRKAEAAYAGNLASTNFNSYASRLQSIAGIGQAAANNQAAQGANYATQVGNLATNGAANTSNAVLSGTSSISNALNQYAGATKDTNASSYLNPISVTPNQITGGF